MVSERYKFCFVHIPKTGGNSIQNSLACYSEDSILCLNEWQDGTERFEIRRSGTNLVKHSTIVDYKRELSKDLFDSLFTFTVIRNPWDRVISYYFSPHRGKYTKWDRAEFLTLLKQINNDEFYLCSKPNSDYEINRFLRFESLQQDFSMLLNELNIPDIMLPQRNRSLLKPEGSYRKFFDDELKADVQVKFCRTIEHFGYEF